MTRPLLAKTVDELDAMARRNLGNAAELTLILDELRHRSTQRARDLRDFVTLRLATQRKASPVTPAKARKAREAASTQGTANVIGANHSIMEQADKPEPIIMSEVRNLTNAAVAQLRAKLLDLSRRSPLISFKHSGRSATMIRIVDERPDLLFQTMCGRNGMYFEPLPDEDTTPKDELTDEFRIAFERARLTDEGYLEESGKLGESEDDALKWEKAERSLRQRVRADLGLPYLDYGKSLDVAALARAHGFDPSYDLKASDGETEEHHEDDRLRVLLTPKQLDTRLKSIWDRYRSHERETGLHTLFLAIGFVQWFDDTTGDTPHVAPALLLAVELERNIVRSRYEYTLKPHEEGLQVNVALAEKMRQHWGLEMPQLRDDESPESYFVRLETILEKGRKVRLRRFVTLAVLPFPRMVLWKDLDPDNWPEDRFAAHVLLPGLLGAAPMGDKPSPAQHYDIDGPEWTGKAPALILPADASQHSALIEVSQGSNLALEGPPGTGKSQTITNMIATAISEGKKVLFVAEKQAALRVVSDRLKEVGLGSLVLELHGEGAKRDEFYRSLRGRMDTVAECDLTRLENRRRDLIVRRDMLRGYLTLLDTPLGELGRTAYSLVWREIGLRTKVSGYVVNNLGLLVGADATKCVDETQLEEMRDELAVFAKAVDALDEGRAERTQWLEASRLSPFDQSEQLRAAERATNAAKECAQALSAFSPRWELNLPAPNEDLIPFESELQSWVPFEGVGDSEVVAALRDPDIVRSLLQKQLRWRQLSAKLGEAVETPRSVTREQVRQLSDAVADLDVFPATVSDVQAALLFARETAVIQDDSRQRRETFASSLGMAGSITTANFSAAAEIIARLAQAGERQLTMMSDKLLDPVVGLAIEEEASRAAALAGEQAALEPDLREGCLAEDPTALGKIADVLEESGFFARLFGAEFKSARKRAARLLRDTADREAAAELLRKAARYNRSDAAFQSDSPAKDLFPSVLWKGSGSDFASIGQARQMLGDARSDLAALGLGGVLERFLANDAQQRGLLGRQAVEVLPTLRRATEMGLGDSPVADLGAALERRRSRLERATEALDAVSAVPDCALVKDGDPLPDQLDAFVRCREDYDNLRGKPLFESVGPVDEAGDKLARALAQVDALRAIDDPFALLAVLAQIDEPVAFLNDLLARRGDLLNACHSWRSAVGQLSEKAGLAVPDAVCDRADDAKTGWAELIGHLEQLSSDESGARLAADLLKYRTRLDERGMQELTAGAINGQVSLEQLPDILELAVVTRLLKEYLNGDGADLQRAGGLNLAAARESFVQIDSELQTLEAQAILAERLKDEAPWGIGHGLKGSYTNKALLDSELALKRPRTPLRDVVHRAGEALQALKPVWMMSPASSAQYIRPGTLDFDILVMDEASQMRPEYAISSVLRGGQLVVVGDANQLPPSDHFQTKDTSDSDDENSSLAADTESILDLANQRFRRKRRLKWHYRSQHESLIAFSNREFYDGELVVFPSPMGNDDELLGVRCVYVPGKFPDTVYDASINQREAEAVIEEAFALMVSYPLKSIGIAAMNAKQTELIAAEFERLTLERPDVRNYIESYSGTVDEFFIKNLENVQGDERDIILISTVYGPGKEGLVRQNFGLMNRDVGWRRLNVLVTRAKLSTRVFSSLRPGDVKITDSSSRGVRAFHAYLTFIHGGAAVDRAGGAEPESPFEVFVADKLREHGFEVVPQVGVDRFRIDLGIRHPDYPYGFLAGVECDGAPFHSGQTVRDRDRIRQKQLENLGWRIYRVWSVDWYADPERELDKLVHWLDAIREKKAGAATARSAHQTVSLPGSPDEADPLPASHQQAAQLESSPPVPAGKGEAQNMPAEPVGTRLRPIDGIDLYEEEKGWFYTVWDHATQLGDITVLSRGDSATRLYGDRIYAPKPEYEGRVVSSGQLFKTTDIYAAVREIKRRSE